MQDGASANNTSRAVSDTLFDPSAFPATRLLFRDDAYLKEAEAQVLGHVGPLLVLDSSLFYAASGGQPSDHGTLRLANGNVVPVTEMKFLDPAKTRIGIALPEGTSMPHVGEKVVQRLDFERRFKLMRVHSALHLLSVALPYPVTGGAVNVDDGRLDFDIPDAGLEKDDLSAKLNALIEKNADISARFITDEELDANPALVKTMSVKPPRGAGVVRLIEIAGLDLQPCGGTHVANTREIGRMQVTNIEKKGKINRRVRIGFV